MKYRRHSHSITNMNFHIILCSKYRKPYLHKIKQALLHSCFRRSCILHGCSLVECEIMPDHIHMFIAVHKPVRFQLHRFMNHLKGWASFRIRRKNLWMKKYKALWSASYFCESIGNISEQTIRKYIRNQKVNVKPGYKFRSLVDSGIKDNQGKHSNNAKTAKEEKKEKANTHYKMLSIRAAQQRAVSSSTLPHAKSKRAVQSHAQSAWECAPLDISSGRTTALSSYSASIIASHQHTTNQYALQTK